jgi:SAM-dependent methyltransferase
MTERDYVLGTHDAEVQRLGLQHQAWRPKALAAWQRAGFTVGQTILDVGCGPGYASLDLAELVGPTGRVIAVDRSRRFLDVLSARAEARGLSNIEVHELDLERDELPEVAVDAAWCRWVFAFMRNPRDLLSRVAGVVRGGGRVVMHEYIAYGTWRLVPPTPELDRFVRVVIETWHSSGGDPDVGLYLPGWLGEEGFEVDVRPLVEILTRQDHMWEWPATFLGTGMQRFIELGMMSREQSRAIQEEFDAAAARPGTRMITPVVGEIVAVKKQAAVAGA